MWGVRWFYKLRLLSLTHNPSSRGCMWDTMHRKLDSWGGCKPLVGLDGCHLKGKFGGHILSAIAWDGNENIFLVALGVIEQENKDS